MKLLVAKTMFSFTGCGNKKAFQDFYYLPDSVAAGLPRDVFTDLNPQMLTNAYSNSIVGCKLQEKAFAWGRCAMLCHANEYTEHAISTQFLIHVTTPDVHLDLSFDNLSKHGLVIPLALLNADTPPHGHHWEIERVTPTGSHYAYCTDFHGATSANNVAQRISDKYIAHENNVIEFTRERNRAKEGSK